MRRDRALLHRILLAAEALPSGGPHVLTMDGENPQDVLDHLDQAEQQKLIRAIVHRAGGNVDHVAVRGLTPAGHDWLEAEARQAGQPPFVDPSSVQGGTGLQGVSGRGTAYPGRFQGVGAKGMAAGEGLARGAGVILSEDGSPLLTEDGTPILSEDADTAHIDGHAGLPQRTIIIRTVLSNQVEAQLTALSLLSAIELKIGVLRESGSNSEVDEFHDLKHRVEEFLAANAKRDEAPIAEATLSIAAGLRRFWSEKHVSICEKALDMTLFGAGLAFCGVAGVLAVPTALTVGVLVGGKTVVEGLKAGAQLLERLDGGE
jgi:uncharacterized protein DUF2513